MDLWNKLESNLAAIEVAGIQFTGEHLPPLRTGGAPKAEQIRANQERERIRTWALSWKRK